MLKKKLTAAQFAELSAALQALYAKAEGSDNYILGVEDDDGAELKKAKDREKKRADDADKKAKDLQDKLTALEEERDTLASKGQKGLDEAGLTKLQQKHTADLAALNLRITGKDKALAELLVDAEATRIANDISTVPDLMQAAIRSRLKMVEGTDGKHTVVVLDADGNDTENKIEDLQKEFVANAKFAPIIQASKASGGGAAGGQKGGGAVKKKLSEMTATEEAIFANEQPAAYQAMLAGTV